MVKWKMNLDMFFASASLLFSVLFSSETFGCEVEHTSSLSYQKIFH